MNVGESGGKKEALKKFKAEVTFNMKCQYNYQPLLA